MKTLSPIFITILPVALAAVNHETKNLIDDSHVNTSWKNEHFNEYHHLGQCDLTLLKDEEFAEHSAIHVHIRTRIARHPSHVKNVSLKIGNDVLVIEGFPDEEEAHIHWMNNEYQQEVGSMSGFPVIMELLDINKRRYVVDMSSKYSWNDITVEVNKQFVQVRLNGDDKIFGNGVGSLRGSNSAGSTEIVELVEEWQVQEDELELFQIVAHPQFPQACNLPNILKRDHRHLPEDST